MTKDITLKKEPNKINSNNKKTVLQLVHYDKINKFIF